MKYDEIKQEQLVSDNPESATKVANLILESIVSFVENSTASPVARFYNLVRLQNHVSDIFEQYQYEAMNYLHELKKGTKRTYYNSVEEATKNTPYETIDGVELQWTQNADFRNWATKDATLNSLLLSEKEAKAAVKRFKNKIDKRISELRADPEYKRGKPTKVWENLTFKDV